MGGHWAHHRDGSHHELFLCTIDRAYWWRTRSTHGSLFVELFVDASSASASRVIQKIFPMQRRFTNQPTRNMMTVDYPGTAIAKLSATKAPHDGCISQYTANLVVGTCHPAYNHDSCSPETRKPRPRKISVVP
ncbi:expressed unknown protein [Seminavis robusta]|uniref:Uncharacterized protein n=1 Tax=Seminavis robusta TaxID=568900 RepID=A0A9N8DGD9_9STRA|nr:expressed unknown protein [Seminavis robusta]|eukprot:Sro144_g067151.1  (133) ;mRNA; f:105170-105568